MSGTSRHNRFLRSLLVASTALIPLGHLTTAQAQSTAQDSAVAFNIPAQSLTSALTSFARQAGVKIAYPASLTSGRSVAPLQGSYSSTEALSRLLAGTGLSYAFTDASTVTITDRVAAAHVAPFADDSTVLDTINVQGGGGQSSVYTPFETAAPTSHISEKTIERFRGSSPADIFRGTPGVMSGEARNGAGSIDVNVRGMQGMDRVRVTVDGAENSLQVYQGYQGISNRTYLDPDLLAGVDITRGSDVSSRGIAGTVAMRTIGADDIVKPGDTWGMRVKGGFGTNTTSPNAGARGGYSWPLASYHDPMVVPSAEGMDRPGFLKPTSGSGSIMAAVKEENYDLFAGYAYRMQGNYYAGTHGAYAKPLNMGPQTICSSASCVYWPEFIANEGIANYRAGEEVLNTQLETHSWLAKATLHLSDEQSLQIGYTGFRSEAGDLMASALTSIYRQPVQNALTTGVELDTGTLRYKWQPSDNDLVDLSANLWVSRLTQRYGPRGWGNIKPESFGFDDDFRVGSDSLLWGGDAANKSHFDLEDYGLLDLTYGVSYISEETSPSMHAHVGPIASIRGFRNASRQEAGTFASAAYEPVDWLTLNAGLRYSHFWSEDQQTSTDWGNVPRTRDDGGFSPSLGVTVEPLKGVQLYANYASALRLPSIVEAGGTFIQPNPDLRPERNDSWEIGTNVIRDGIFADNDSGMVKFGYFNWDVKDYIARQAATDGGFSLSVDNIDRAKFSGLEFSTRYERSGFTAELNANYYLGVDFCQTADTCANASLYGDYATNQVPPEYSIDLTLSQKMMDERLTLGGRIMHVGPRAAGHGQTTITGLMQFISMVSWEPYTLVDVFAEYKLNDNVTASFRIENLTDQYYVDPLSLVRQPGPGRSFYASLTGNFGGAQAIPNLSKPFDIDGAGKIDWTGVYAGFHAGTGSARTWGDTTFLDGTTNDMATAESANLRMNGMLAGVQAGYNWQFGNGVVLGFEGDWSKTYHKGQQKAYATWISDPGSGALGTDVQAVTNYEIDWTASLRGRVGYAFDNRWLAYGTAGVAFAKETQWRDQYTDLGGYSTTTKFAFSDNTSVTRAGFTLGGGAEYAINDRWSIKADYSYSRFGRKDINMEKGREGIASDYTDLVQVGTKWVTPDFPFCDEYPIACQPYEVPVMEPVIVDGSPTVGRQASNALDLHSFKIGLNYRF